MGLGRYGAVVAGDYRVAATMALDCGSPGHACRCGGPLRLIDAQLRRFRCLSLHLRPQPAQAAPRTQRTTTRLESEDASAGLFHLHQLSANHGDGVLLLSVSKSLTREVV